jgi:SAM-dependent methyltransferase
MLEKARKRDYERLIVHNLESYPYDEQSIPPATFDAVVCVGVMDFIVGPRAFLKYIRGLLKPNGASADGEPLPRSVLGLTLPERHSYSDLSSFTRMEMEQLLRGSGYLIERHERFIGYQDSQTGREQYYHGWLCTLI